MAKAPDADGMLQATLPRPWYCIGPLCGLLRTGWDNQVCNRCVCFRSSSKHNSRCFSTAVSWGVVKRERVKACVPIMTRRVATLVCWTVCINSKHQQRVSQSNNAIHAAFCTQKHAFFQRAEGPSFARLFTAVCIEIGETDQPPHPRIPEGSQTLFHYSCSV